MAQAYFDVPVAHGGELCVAQSQVPQLATLWRTI